MERIAVVGTSCSGKSTFGRELAARLGVPHTELDALHWEPGWNPADPEIFRARVQAIVERPTWIIDGNYAAVRDLVWRRATTLVWLNLPFSVVFARAVTRTFRRIATQEALYNGNRESLRNALDRDWIPWWVIRTWRRRRREYGERIAQPEFSQLEVVELTTAAEVERFLAEVPGSGNSCAVFTHRDWPGARLRGPMGGSTRR